MVFLQRDQGFEDIALVMSWEWPQLILLWFPG